ncbi:helix-turn-helix transcriptional regulator [Lagierella sp.]|uniref:helix-turn-helix domain-containing protein n=1 Tax=Lagierella sp. TaxID=2849657 RepID=UPI00260D563B|nr:helix-turn-helix transcriptional regulator [Lagierella sp.]
MKIDEDLKRHIALKVKNCRRKHGYSQLKLAEALGVSMNTVQNIELGVRLPSAEVVINLDALIDTDIRNIIHKFVSTPELKFKDYSDILEKSYILGKYKEFDKYLEELDFYSSINEAYFEQDSFERKIFYYFLGKQKVLKREFEQGKKSLDKALNIKCKKFEKCKILNSKIEVEKLKIDAYFLREEGLFSRVLEISNTLKTMLRSARDTKLKMEIAYGIAEIYMYILEDYEQGHLFLSEIEDESFVVEYPAYFTRIFFLKSLCKRKLNYNNHGELETALRFYEVFGGSEELEILKALYRDSKDNL